MKLVYGDFWEYPADWRCITTNGTVTKAGENVMGGGVALEAKQRYPELPAELGQAIKEVGIGVANLSHNVIAFPVKTHVWQKASLSLIEQSMRDLSERADMFPDDIFVLNRPGIGLGGLAWEDVEPLLTSLPDNVHIITWGAA